MGEVEVSGEFCSVLRAGCSGGGVAIGPAAASGRQRRRLHVKRSGSKQETQRRRLGGCHTAARCVYPQTFAEEMEMEMEKTERRRRRRRGCAARTKQRETGELDNAPEQADLLIALAPCRRRRRRPQVPSAVGTHLGYHRAQVSKQTVETVSEVAAVGPQRQPTARATRHGRLPQPVTARVYSRYISLVASVSARRGDDMLAWPLLIICPRPPSLARLTTQTSPTPGFASNTSMRAHARRLRKSVPMQLGTRRARLGHSCMP